VYAMKEKESCAYNRDVKGSIKARAALSLRGGCGEPRNNSTSKQGRARGKDRNTARRIGAKTSTGKGVLDSGIPRS